MGRRGRIRAGVVACALSFVAPGLGDRPAVAAPAPAGWTTPTIVDTRYAVPANALFVSTVGDDANAGTIDQPLRNVATAIARATTTQTVVVRGGEYRESFGLVRKKITVQPYPHEKVWVKGSDIVTGWQPLGTMWQVGGWNPPLCRNCYDPAAIDPAFPLAGRPDQVFVDGAPQVQVASAAAVVPGTFFVDVVNQELDLGSDPNGHTVEATTREYAFSLTATAASSMIRGIGFAQFGAHLNYDVPAIGIIDAKGVRLLSDTFAWSASRGVFVGAYSTTITDSLFVDNGANGLSANDANRLAFTRNHVQFSNFERFSIVPSAHATIGALKITATAAAVIRRNVFSDNGANGIWLDNDTRNSVITQNVVLRNAGHGIAVEVSGATLVAGNVVADNARIGVKVVGSSSVRVWDNTIANNGGAQLGVYEEPRVAYSTVRTEVVNNVLVAPAAQAHAIFDSDDIRVPVGVTTLDMVTRDDRNLYARPGGGGRAVATWRVTLASVQSFGSVAGLRSATQREIGSIAADGVQLTTLFIDAANGDYTPGPRSPAGANGVVVPNDVASAIGVPKGSAPPALGAFTVVAH